MADIGTNGGIDLSDLSPVQKKAMEVLAAGGTLKDLRGLSGQDIESIYAIGFNLYNQAKYDQAEPMFQFACFYDHSEPRYWIALGNCRQMAKNYRGAIDCFGYAFLQDITNPWPAINTAVCYLALQDKGQAEDALTLAEKTIENGKPDPTAEKRIQALRQAV